MWCSDRRLIDQRALHTASVAPCSENRYTEPFWSGGAPSASFTHLGRITHKFHAVPIPRGAHTFARLRVIICRWRTTTCSTERGCRTSPKAVVTHVSVSTISTTHSLVTSTSAKATRCARTVRGSHATSSLTMAHGRLHPLPQPGDPGQHAAISEGARFLQPWGRLPCLRRTVRVLSGVHRRLVERRGANQPGLLRRRAQLVRRHAPCQEPYAQRGSSRRLADRLPSV
jgi:hypothetical protein